MRVKRTLVNAGIEVINKKAVVIEHEQFLFNRYGRLLFQMIKWLESGKTGRFEYQFNPKAENIKSMIPVSKNPYDGYLTVWDAEVYILKKFISGTAVANGKTFQWYANGVTVTNTSLHDTVADSDAYKTIDKAKTVVKRRKMLPEIV